MQVERLGREFQKTNDNQFYNGILPQCQSYKYAKIQANPRNFCEFEWCFWSLFLLSCKLEQELYNQFLQHTSNYRMAEQAEFDYLFKIVIIGDSGVGKSNLLSKYVSNSFHENTKATIGVELLTKTLTIDGKVIQNQIWDTAGQERFRAITTAYYRSAVGAIIVFDLTKPKTFQNLKKWLKEVHDYAEPNTSVIVIGNKSDLTDSKEIKAETIDDFITQNHLTYLQTSALTGYNVARAFQSLIRDIYEKQQRRSSGRRAQEGGFPNPSGLAMTKLDTDRPNSQRTKLKKPSKKLSKMNCC